MRDCSLCLLATGLTLFLAFAPGHAAPRQDREKKNEKGVIAPDSAARAADELELMRSWSFGFQHYRNKQYAHAAPCFWKVIAVDTLPQLGNGNSLQFPQVFDFLGQSYFQLNKSDSAQLVYELGVRALPNDVSLRRTLAYLLTVREQYAAALAEYQKIRESDAATEDDWRRMGNLYVRVNQYDEAIAAYEKTLALQPNDAETRQTLAALYRAAGREEAALANLETALAQKPDDFRLAFNLAQARFKRQEYDKAIALLSRFRQLESADGIALELLGEAQSRLGRHREALQTFEQLIAARPTAKKILVSMSHCYRELGDFPAARRMANKALAADAEYGAAHLALGLLYENCAEKCVAKKGKSEYDDKLVYELAYRQYEKALQDAEARAEARQHLNFLAALIPQTEDRFMNKGKDKAAGSCYQWIY